MMRCCFFAFAAFAVAATPVTATDQAPLEFKHVMPALDNYGYVSKNHLWPSSTVSVCWENPSPDNVQQRLEAEMAVEQSWEKYANLVFTGWANTCVTGAGGVHIYVVDEQPHSLIGSRLDGQTRGVRLNFTFARWGQSYCARTENRDDCIRTAAIHEFGHVLGLIHESLRPDAPASCKDSYAASNDGSDPGDGEERTPYDPDSIMNYCSLTYGKRTSLSANDKLVAAIMYPTPGK
jgi:hypothetical protein